MKLPIEGLWFFEGLCVIPYYKSIIFCFWIRLIGNTPNMRTSLLLSSLITIFLCSCRKDPEISIDIPYQPDSILIVNKPGSWWKYEWFEIDSMGNEFSLGGKDCLYVVGDTTINGNIFTHITGDSYMFPTPSNWFWRDSSHYLVDQFGNKLFSTYEKLDTLKIYPGSQYTIYSITHGIESPCTVPAGAFMVYENELHYHNSNGTPFTACDSIYISYRRFANGIGIISEQLSFASLLQIECKYMERRLIEYYIPE